MILDFIKTHPTLICALFVSLIWFLFVMFYKPQRNTYAITTFSIVYFLAIIHKLNQGPLLSDITYMFANWLINFRGGFIRRGLGGEIVLWFTDLCNTESLIVIYIISASMYFLLISFFIIQFMRKKHPLFILMSPFFLGETVFIDPSQWLRKDSLCLLIFIFSLYIFKKFQTSLWSIFLLNTLFIFGILIHEVVFFFAFPILFISFWHKNRSISQTILFFTPSIITFVLCFIISKYADINQMINLTPEITDPGSLKHLSMNTTMYFDRFWGKINNPGILFHVAYTGVLIAAIFVVCVKFTKMSCTKSSTVNEQFLSQILFFQLLSIFPLFCIGWDWGRWIFFWISSSFAYFLIIEENPFEKIRLPKFLNIILSDYMDRHSKIVFFVTIFINCQFMLPYKIDFLSNSPAYLVFSELSFAIMQAKNYLIAFLG